MIPLFQRHGPRSRLSVSDRRMTRFRTTVRRAVVFVIDSFEQIAGGQILVSQIPPTLIPGLSAAAVPDASTEVGAICSGQRLLDEVISKDDARQRFEFGGRYVVARRLGYCNGLGPTESPALGTECDVAASELPTKSDSSAGRKGEPYIKSRVGFGIFGGGGPSCSAMTTLIWLGSLR